MKSHLTYLYESAIRKVGQILAPRHFLTVEAILEMARAHETQINLLPEICWKVDF